MRITERKKQMKVRKFKSQISNRDVVDCVSSQFKEPNLKTKNMHQFFHNIAKKERDGCTKLLTFIGRWSAVELCC